MHRKILHIIAAIAVVTVSTHCRAERGKRNVSSNGEFSFQVEADGRVLPVYNHRGRSYIEGRWGDTYAIRVFNHTGSRVEAVVTVDGRDVITGNEGDYRKGRGYVISPYGSVLIDGFRTSWQNVAAFRFTDVGDSYAARRGDASNVGVIGVAVFKEKTYRPRRRPVPYRDYRRERDQGLGTGYGRGAPSSPKSSAKRGGPPEAESLDGAYDSYAPAPRRHRQGLGTQYGDDTYSPSTSTTFHRASRRPRAMLAIRYDDRQGLIALGVLPRPVPRPYYRRPRPKPDPFPLSPEPVTFAPPPPSYYWE